MSVLKYPGSKNQCTDWIIENFPAGYKKMTYLELFFGSGAVFFAKERSVVETINDINHDVVNLFKCIREKPSELARTITYTPWSREEFILSKEETTDSLERSRRFIVRNWFSIGARSEGFRSNIKGNNGNLASFHNTLPIEILAAADRLSNKPNSIVQIENSDALKLIEKYNRNNVLIYLDPPYLLSTRKNRHIYEYEMTADQHEQLLSVIADSKAYVLISGYDNDLYNRILSGWKKETRKVRAEQGKTRTECLWRNYDSRQYLLFAEDP